MASEKIYLAEQSVIEAVTLSASAWSNNTYTLTTDNLKSDTQLVELLPAENITLTQYNALINSMIIGGGQSATDKTLTLKALADAPTIDIPVVFVFRGDVK